MSRKAGETWGTPFLFFCGDRALPGFSSHLVGTPGACPSANISFSARQAYGGDPNCQNGEGCGVVYKLTPDADGTWSETVLHAFTGGSGAYPQAGLIFDAVGNLYGTTSGGGAGGGVVFELMTKSDGTWRETVLHEFAGPDGFYPWGKLTLGADGILYGTTYFGGSCPGNDIGCGLVFKLAQTSNGWSETVQHAFSGYGAGPEGGLTMDAAGSLYGTVTSGSANNGFVFEILKCPDVVGK